MTKAINLLLSDVFVICFACIPLEVIGNIALYNSKIQDNFVDSLKFKSRIFFIYIQYKNFTKHH